MKKRKSDREAVERPGVAAQPDGANDFRTYGYAHRAHSPDPNANYTFNPEATRVLPKDKRLRWKVTG